MRWPGQAWLTLALALPMLAACTRPYAEPIIVAEPQPQADASFPGFTQLIDEATARKTTMQFIWTHGMCEHHEIWARDRIDRIKAAMSASETVLPHDLEQPGKLALIPASFHAPNGDFSGSFILWSPMTAGLKQALDADRPGADPAQRFPYRRATLNNSLKVGLMNDCLADAVVYLGPNGDPIRAAMQEAVCRALGGTMAPRQPCDLTGADLDRPLAIVTESLGSKFLFDAVRALFPEGGTASAQRSALERRLASVRVVYLVANQIPLLDVAGKPTAATGAVATGAVATAAPPMNTTLTDFLGLLQRAREAARSATTAAPQLPPPTVVAFSDPNDILSYRLLPAMMHITTGRLVDVIVSNGDTYAGYLENPLDAHCGYAWNRKVIGLIAQGYTAGKPVPLSPPLAASACL
jgi:hypothetical protein